MIEHDDVIKQHLIEVNDLLVAALPLELRHDFLMNAFIAGGAIVSLVLGETPNDYDYFIKTAELKKNLVEYFNANPITVSHEVKAVTENGITLELRAPKGNIDIQIITRFIGPIDRVFTSFDYEHCKAYFDLSTHNLYYKKDIIMRKELIYTGQDGYPVNAVKRLVRFVRRGWKPQNETIMNLVDAISALDMKCPAVRADQLIGFYGSSLE